MFKVLAEAAVAAEPCQCSFHDPAAGQDLEALCGIGSLDDLDGPSADAAQRFAQLIAGIATIGEQVAQPGEAVDDFSAQQRRPVTVPDITGVDHRHRRHDTGISNRLVQKLIVSPMGRKPVVSAAGTNMHNLHTFRLGFVVDQADGSPAFPYFLDRTIEGMSWTDHPVFDVLIGIDVIGLCELTITRKGTFRLILP